MSKLEMLTPQNSAIALIDYQPAMYQGVQSHDRIVVFNNIQILKGGEALQDTDGAEHRRQGFLFRALYARGDGSLPEPRHH